MCHQSVGLIARHLEANGFATVGLTSAVSITESANPPRSVFVDAPLGHTAGPANDPNMQTRILSEGLAAGVAMKLPGIVNLPYRWYNDDWRTDALSWSRKREQAGSTGSDAGDSREGRSEMPKYQTEADRAAAEAVSIEDQCMVCLGL